MALQQTIIPNLEDSNSNYLFSTIWIAILKTDNIMVADLCFYGKPNDDGQVEIGYGTYPDFENKGYMTEMVHGILDWIRSQDHIKSVIAHSDNSNIASLKVLTKNAFEKIGEIDGLIKWKLEIKV